MIDITRDLPPRATPLDHEKLARVFGGAFTGYQSCKKNKDCANNKCENGKCKLDLFRGYS